MPYALNDEEVYQREYDRAAGRAQQRYERSAAEFAEMLTSACLFDRAFLSDRDLARCEFPETARVEGARQSEAAKALHRIWRQYQADDSALTGNERALAQYADAIVRNAVDTEAERVAVDYMDAGPDEPARLRAGGAL